MSSLQHDVAHSSTVLATLLVVILGLSEHLPRISSLAFQGVAGQDGTTMVACCSFTNSPDIDNADGTILRSNDANDATRGFLTMTKNTNKIGRVKIHRFMKLLPPSLEDLPYFLVALPPPPPKRRSDVA